jgi:hypothetical protein
MNTKLFHIQNWWLARIITIIIFILIAYGLSHIAESPAASNAVLPVKNFSEITDSEKTDFYTLDAKYPSDPLDRNNNIKTWAESIISKTKEDWKTGGETQQAELELAKQFPDRPAMQYNMNIDYTKHVSQKLGTVSYVMQHYEFTGGAHGNTNLKIFNFNKNGSIVLSDVLIITNENHTSLAKTIREKLLENLGDMADESMIRDGLDCELADDAPEEIFCDHHALRNNLEKFYITDTGITFVFGQYQVAAYAVGMPEVTLSWSELGPFMNPEFDLPLD